MNDVFRLRKYYRNLPLVGLLFFVGMLVVSVYLAASEGNKVAAVVFAGFWGFWVGLAVWMLLAYCWGSLCIRNGTLIHQGAVRTTSVDLSELVDLQWRTPGTIVLRSQSEKIKVYLDHFEPEQRQRLIRLLHLSVPRSIQRDWDRFCYEVAMPLLRCSVEHPLREDERLFARWHIDRIFIPVILLVAAIGGGFAWHLQAARWLFVPVPFVVLWLFLRALIPAKGLLLLSREKLDNRFFLGLVIWGAVGIIGVYVFDIFQRHLPYPSWWAWLGILLWLFVLPVQVHRADRRRRQSERGQIELAVQQWERQEAGATQR
jgi:hypothetical protein